MLSLLQNWMPVAASEHAPQIDNMISIIHWLMAVLFIGWILYFVYVLFRFRAGANPRASYTGTTSHFNSYIEVGVAVFEVVLLVFFAIPVWASWVAPHDEAANPVEVRVVAEQFAWNIHYPGPDGVFGPTDIHLITPTNPLGLDRDDIYGRDDVTTVNQLHLPVDRPVFIRLSSKDVIHSFSLNQMRVKQDAVPGLLIPVRFTPVMVTPPEARQPVCNGDKTCWEIACSQLCGLGHYRMRGFYTIHTQEEFDAWMAEEVAKVLPQPEPEVEPEPEVVAEEAPAVPQETGPDAP